MPPMLISEMEAVLRNLDDRVGRIEQILPTLATKTDLERYATKADLERFATKADLERLSTRTDLELSAIRTAVETSERRIRVLFEHLSGSVETLRALVGPDASVVRSCRAARSRPLVAGPLTSPARGASARPPS